MLPQNVSLKQLDSLGDVPTELQGRYDVVHLRMWANNLSSKEVGSFLCNLSKMLSIEAQYSIIEDFRVANRLK